MIFNNLGAFRDARAPPEGSRRWETRHRRSQGVNYSKSNNFVFCFMILNRNLKIFQEKAAGYVEKYKGLSDDAKASFKEHFPILSGVVQSRL